MRKSQFLSCASICLVILGVLGVFRVSAADLKTLHGHVPAVISSLTPTGRLPATNELRMAIGLPLHNMDALNDFMTHLYDPKSPSFRHYLTREEFTEQFGPTKADYEAVKAFATSNSLTIVLDYSNRLLLDVTGPASAIEKAFHITLRTYHLPTEDRDFYGPDTEPSVDADLPVVDVQGLSDYSRPIPRLHKKVSSSISHKSGTSPDGDGDFFGNDFRTAYAPDTTLTGAGQSIGLFEADGYYANDIAAYAAGAGNGRTNIIIQRVLIDNFSGNPTTGSKSGNPEVSLDIELAMAMAPGLSTIVVFEGNPKKYIPNDILNAMLAYSSTVKNLSCSWGWSGGPTAATGLIFTNMAAVGQSFFNASGDSCAFTTGATSVNGVDNTTIPNAPSSFPIITVVGGTTLTMNGTAASYAGEIVWNWGIELGSSYNGVGSSGGISSYFTIPTYQLSVNNMTARGGSTSNRNIPDVACTADDVYVIAGGQAQGASGYGGTSCAAPLWAGFAALANQQAAAGGLPSVGFVNPVLYTLAAGPNSSEYLHDITSGNNTWTDSPNLFYATNGYDLCTGLGSPAGQNLINALAGSATFSVSPLTDSASGVAGGPFVITSSSLMLTNAGSSTISWSLSNTPTWISITPTSGTLSAASHTTLACQLTSAANSLSVGGYTANLVFSNLTAGTALNGSFTLQVNQPMAISPAKGFAAVGPAGGAFSPNSQAFILTNQSASSIAWSLENTSSWLSFSPSNGTLSSGSQTTITANLTPAANSLALGSYTGTVTITNFAGSVASMVFSLQVNQPMTISPTNGFTSSGQVGGPFNVTSQVYTLSNQSANSLSWSAVNPASWLTISPSNGIITGGGSTSVTVSINSSADFLSSSSYTDTALFTNFAGTAANLVFTLNVGQSIVSNGGFETGSFAGWTLNGSAQYNIVASSSSFVHSGKYGAELGQSGSLAYLSQTLATTPGQNYILSLWLANPTNADGATPNQFLVQWNGTTIFNQTNIPFGSWTNLQFVVTATSASTILEIGAEDNPYYLGLDDVSVNQLSPPQFRSTQKVNSGISFTWSATANVTYQVQYTTNLANPTWINLGAPQLANTNTLSFIDTNKVSSSPGRFYRIIEQ